MDLPIDRTRHQAGREQSGADAATEPPITRGRWLVVASTIVMFGGFFNVVDGLVALFKPSYFVGQPVFGDLWIWAILWMGFGFLQMATGGVFLTGTIYDPVAEVRMRPERSGVTAP